MKKIDQQKRKLLQMMAVAAALPAGAFAHPRGGAIQRKKIPHTNETLPSIGLGTSRSFNASLNDKAMMQQLSQVLRHFFAAGGTLIDSSPMYGAAEAVLGTIFTKVNRELVFSATKVWTDGKKAGMDQMQESLRLWHLPTFDLMQIHNLRDWRTHLSTLKQWKEEKRIRYIGVTTYDGHDHDELAQMLKHQRGFDFVQLSYHVLNRTAEKTLFPIIADKGIAVIANRPFQRGDLFRLVKNRPLPPWAAEIHCMSWAQVLLKYIVSHPLITCAIPATSKPKHIRDNMAAMRDIMPDKAMRKTIERYFARLH